MFSIIEITFTDIFFNMILKHNVFLMYFIYYKYICILFQCMNFIKYRDVRIYL